MQDALNNLVLNRGNFLIKEKGRNLDEDAIVVVQEGAYYGFGFVPKEISLGALDDVMAYVQPQKETVETKRLVVSYALKHQEKIILIQNFANDSINDISLFSW